MAIAEWLIGRINEWCARSGGRLIVVRSAAELQRCTTETGATGILIGVQGGHALDGDLRNVERMQDLGVRMLAPAHVMDNELVGSGTGSRADELTGFGREVIAELERRSIIVDLAHMSARGVLDALPLLRRPFTLSHTGLTDVSGRGSRWRRYSPATRNVPVSLAADVGAAGGLIGIALSTELLGGQSIADAVATIRLALRAAGEHRVAIGSDMDGALKTVIDMAGLPALTTALLGSGLAEHQVEGVMGRNAVDFLRRALPSDARPAVKDALWSPPPAEG